MRQYRRIALDSEALTRSFPATRRLPRRNQQSPFIGTSIGTGNLSRRQINEQHFSRLDFPFQTQNAALAFALYISGIPFADKNAPLTNTYDGATLRKLGYHGAIEEAAAAAFASNHHGEVVYGFAQTNQLGEALQSFDTQQKAAAATDELADVMVGAMQANLATGLLSPTEAIASATCIVLKRRRQEISEWELHRDYNMQHQKHKVADWNGRELAEKTFMAGGFYPFAAVIVDARIAFLSLWKNYQPFIRLHRAGKPNQDGERVRLPGFMWYSENAERETRRNIGAPTK